MEQMAEPCIAVTEMVDPHRGVGQNHAAPDRRRGIGRNFFCEPPSRASRRALSRAIRASRPRWIRAVFSRTPVRLAALLINSWSRFRVVLMHIKMHDSCRYVKRDGEPVVQITPAVSCGMGWRGRCERNGRDRPDRQLHGFVRRPAPFFGALGSWAPCQTATTQIVLPSGR